MQKRNHGENLVARIHLSKMKIINHMVSLTSNSITQNFQSKLKLYSATCVYLISKSWQAINTINFSHQNLLKSFTGLFINQNKVFRNFFKIQSFKNVQQLQLFPRNCVQVPIIQKFVTKCQSSPCGLHKIPHIVIITSLNNIRK